MGLWPGRGRWPAVGKASPPGSLPGLAPTIPGHPATSQLRTTPSQGRAVGKARAGPTWGPGPPCCLPLGALSAPAGTVPTSSVCPCSGPPGRPRLPGDLWRLVSQAPSPSSGGKPGLFPHLLGRMDSKHMNNPPRRFGASRRGWTTAVFLCDSSGRASAVPAVDTLGRGGARRVSGGPSPRRRPQGERRHLSRPHGHSPAVPVPEGPRDAHSRPRGPGPDGGRWEQGSVWHVAPEHWGPQVSPAPSSCEGRSRSPCGQLAGP